ncbi:MAG: 2,3-bisphosphoglycerate-dependent phosphoglycerate mutase [Hyphomicrobiales bacterium]
MDRFLALMRHGQSEWNRRNLFTGWSDPGLSEKGIRQARRAGRALKSQNCFFDIAFTSRLARAERTLSLVLEELRQSDIEIRRDPALNERDYGELTGLDKNEARARWGAEQVRLWRRSFDVAPPGGESLENTAARVLPYFRTVILPHLAGEKGRVLIVAHGNSLRALIMDLEQLSAGDVVKRELATGIPILYHLDSDGAVVEKQELVCRPD